MREGGVRGWRQGGSDATASSNNGGETHRSVGYSRVMQLAIAKETRGTAMSIAIHVVFTISIFLLRSAASAAAAEDPAAGPTASCLRPVVIFSLLTQLSTVVTQVCGGEG